MPENINEQLNIADVQGGENSEGRDNSRPKIEISSTNPQLSKAADQLNELYAKVAGDRQVNAETLQKVREQVLALQNRERETTKIYVGPLYPGIFANKDIDRIYTSYPEGKIERGEITIGNKNKVELIKELDELDSNTSRRKFSIDDDAKRILDDSNFTVAEKEGQISLIRLKVRDLGFPQVATIQEIYKKVQELGLELCPPETGPQLRLNYDQFFKREQPKQERIYIGMKQIDAEIFTVKGDRITTRGGITRKWLSGMRAESYDQYGADDEFIFCSPKQ